MDIVEHLRALGMGDGRAALVAELARRCAKVPGIRAIVLGGSFARGDADASSDVDVAIYYDDAPLPDLALLSQSVRAVDGVPSQTELTPFYAWGPWVNGGAWIKTPFGRVDLLYRELGKLLKTWNQVCQGVVEHDFRQQPPFGFWNVNYLAEICLCRPLADPADLIAGWKREVSTYPEPLRTTMLQQTPFSIEHSLYHAEAFARRDDPFNAQACLHRAIHLLLQRLFALNRVYWFGDKGAVAAAEAFAQAPRELAARIRSAVAHARAGAADSAHFADAVGEVRALLQETGG